MSEVDPPMQLRKYGGVVNVVRLGLTEQDAAGGLPSFPVATKTHDPRFNSYVGCHAVHYAPMSTPRARRFVADLECRELDPLSPVVLRDRVEHAISDRLNLEAWNRAEITEAAERESLKTILNAWPGISGQVSK
jgi:hypothetical protein